MTPTSPVTPLTSEEACPESKRADGKHSWGFDGDDPYVVCHFCGERRDALTGRTIEAASRAVTETPEGLDVERLARAWVNTMTRPDGRGGRWGTEVLDKDWRLVAAEYDRLSAHKEEHGG